jgi:Gylcosyl hydrolase family 115 C-terminal domain
MRPVVLVKFQLGSRGWGALSAALMLTACVSRLDKLEPEIVQSAADSAPGDAVGPLSDTLVTERDTSIPDACSVCADSSADGGLTPRGIADASSCSEGTAADTSVVDSGNAPCIACTAGHYCPGGASPSVACGPDDFDHDEDAATPCEAKQTCQPGQYVAYAGSTTDDRACADCGPRQFSSEVNALTCQAWTRCLAPGAFVLTEPTAETDRECGECVAPEVTQEDNASSCAPPSFQMEDGVVVIEAEHYLSADSQGSSHAWIVLEMAGISGDTCVTTEPDDGTTWGADTDTAAPRLDYSVNFSRSGTFYAFVRGDAATYTGRSDSCSLGIDGVVVADYLYGADPGVWAWVRHTVTISTPGLHTVSLYGREDGGRVDKIVISMSPATPTGNGPPESPLR